MVSLLSSYRKKPAAVEQAITERRLVDVQSGLLRLTAAQTVDWGATITAARSLVHDGVRQVIATTDTEMDASSRQSIEMQVRRLLVQQCIPLEVTVAAILSFDATLMPRATAWGETIREHCVPYVLVRPPRWIRMPMGSVIGELRRMGLHPVIVGADESPFMLEDPKVLQSIVAAGCKVQLSAWSVLEQGTLRARVTRAWMKQGLVHYISSGDVETSDADRRWPSIADAYRSVCRQYGKARADEWFVENPRELFAGVECRCCA